MELGQDGKQALIEQLEAAHVTGRPEFEQICMIPAALRDDLLAHLRAEAVKRPRGRPRKGEVRGALPA